MTFLPPPPSPRRRPTVRGGRCLLVGFIAGAALQLQQAVLWPGSAYAMLTAAALAVLGLSMGWLTFGTRGRSMARLGLALVAAAAFALGFASTGWRACAFQADALDPALEGRDLELTGQVLAMPQVADDGVRFRLAVASAVLLTEGGGAGDAVRLPPRILLGWYAAPGSRDGQPLAPGGIQDALDGAGGDGGEGESEAPTLLQQRQPQVLRAGERWRMTVRLKAPHGSVNPHGFDQELALWEQGLQATGSVRVGKGQTPPRRLPAGRWQAWAHPVELARQAVREAIYRRVPDRRLAGVLAALVVGDQAAIGRADWEVFRTTGVAHLMSISGLHITMFAWLAARLIGGLWRRSARLTPRLCLWLPAAAAGAWGGLLLALLYALFSGWGVPAQRTVCMLAIMVALRQGARQWPWWAAWLLAMAAVVALDPWALVQAGFWLSFVAVGVLFATDSAEHGDAGEGGTAGWLAWRAWPGRVAGSLRRAMQEQWVVTLALTPLSLLLFNQVSVVGLLANAVAIPWVTLVVTPLAMAGVLLPPLWDVAAPAAGLLADGLQWLAGWPFASFSVAAAPLWCAACGGLGGVLMAMRLPWGWRLLGLPLALPVLLWQPPGVADGEFELLGADIGQGNAVLVRTAGHALLYDTGPAYANDSDAGQRVLVPLMRAMAVRLDLLMLSHRDSDHIGGAPAVLALQPQAGLVSSIEDTHPLQALRPARRCEAGQRWHWDGVDFEVLQPPASAYGQPLKSNAMSCVLRIASRPGPGRPARVALLVGDIEAPQEEALVTAAQAGGPPLAADFLLVPHHGSKTSSTAVFIDAVRPRWALAQAGYRNRFGHPVAPVVARYEAGGVRLAVSPACGAARWSSRLPDVLVCQRDEGRRYWHHRL